MAGTCLMLAHQVAGKVARDGFFLLEFEPWDLPKIVATAALLSIGLALLFSKVLERKGPANLVPSTFAVSAMLHVGEWLLLPVAPRPTVILIYLHIVGLGAILLSGFWSLLSEVFDPREAKARFGRIAGAGTAGGIAGGILAERLVAWTGTNTLLFLLAALHLGCAAISLTFGGQPARKEAASRVTTREALTRTPLLWRLAALVFLGTCTAALLDYLFKLGAAQTMGKGPALLRYFAVYYTSCQILTFLVQVLSSSWLLQKLGVAKSVASLPLAVGGASAAALLIPAYPFVVFARAMEMILRGSLFRSGYELLYTPVPASDKRRVKTIVDVGCDRFGDAVGAGAVQVMVWLGPTLARPEILGLAIGISVVSTTLAFSVSAAYRSVLEMGLLRRAKEDRPGEDPSMMNTMFEGMPSLTSFRLPRAAAQPPVALETVPREKVKEPVVVPSVALLKPQDPSLACLADLRSQNPVRVTKVLKDTAPVDPMLVPQIIRLLAWDEVSALARAYLDRCGTRIGGQLTDALTDPDVEFGIRRRIPRLLARIATPAAVDGLLQGLGDQRFEVRFQCGRGLEYIHRRYPDMEIRQSGVLEAVNRELSVSKSIWRSWKVMERRDSTDDYNFLDEVLRERADHSLEHVFSLLAVVFPREPLMAAFRALHQEDRMFRGLALEYLENILPDHIRGRLWAILEEEPGRDADSGPNQSVLEELLMTDAKLVLRLKELRTAEARRMEKGSGDA